MSNTPRSTSKAAPTNEAEASSGSTSRWNRLDQDTQAQNITFVHHDPSEDKSIHCCSSSVFYATVDSATETGRLTRGVQHGSSDDGEGSRQAPVHKNGGSKYIKRRNIRRHRNKHYAYVQQLEAEIARLQNADALVNNEKNALAHQNNAMREAIASQSLDVHISYIDLNSFIEPSNELSQLGSAAPSPRICRR
ncbi:hypothetical protein LTR37_003169 [Vermiconidia calcicola]|uniref:Uncharacterized protein n=1 Tax=Vermiconidia calcicola TaxID=1690605 RepID=A0ACC3NQV0_9PEZI|nr:hypothetical protein LTR37_003169 [Vermiconidia calcicola]